MNKDELKNRISLALKDPILQLGFEIICINLAELEKENAKLKSIADFQTSSNMERHFQLKRNKEQLTKAKEFLNEFMRISKASDEDFEHDYSELIEEAELFLKEVE